MTDSFADGILFFIAVQLLIVAAMHFMERKNQKSIFLALICLVNGLWYFYFVFHQVWKKDLLLGILIGPDKNIFLPVLIYFYLKSIRGRLTSKLLGLHLLLPVLFYAISLFFQFSPDIPWSAHAYGEVSVLIVFPLILFGVYFLKARKELESNLKSILLPKVYKRIKLFFYAFYAPLLIIPLFDIANALLTGNGQSFDSIPIQTARELVYASNYALSYLLSLYALTELSFVRKLLFPGNALVSKNLLDNKLHIDGLVEKELIGKKLFQNAGISADSFASKAGLTKKEILDYLELTRKVSFSEFINRLRVNEFKARVSDAKNQHLDLVGLAKECGFQSKSTFFRVFKEIEGITPNEYKKQP